MQTARIERQRYREPRGFPRTAQGGHQRGTRNVLLLGAWGLLTGAIAWNATGFWRSLDQPAGATMQMTAVAPESRVVLPTIFLIDPENCTALVLDRRTNHTEMQPCPQSGLALRLDANSERESLAIR